MNHRANVIFDDPKASNMLGAWDFIGENGPEAYVRECKKSTRSIS
jgi:hypothetical protein